MVEYRLSTSAPFYGFVLYSYSHTIMWLKIRCSGITFFYFKEKHAVVLKQHLKQKTTVLSREWTDKPSSKGILYTCGPPGLAPQPTLGSQPPKKSHFVDNVLHLLAHRGILKVTHKKKGIQ